MKYLLLIVLVLVLAACWTGGVTVKGVRIHTWDNGHEDYYVTLIDEEIEVTKGVYDKVVEKIAAQNGRALMCDFDGLGSVYDDVFCRFFEKE